MFCISNTATASLLSYFILYSRLCLLTHHKKYPVLQISCAQNGTEGRYSVFSGLACCCTGGKKHLICPSFFISWQFSTLRPMHDTKPRTWEDGRDVGLSIFSDNAINVLFIVRNMPQCPCEEFERDQFLIKQRHSLDSQRVRHTEICTKCARNEQIPASGRFVCHMPVHWHREKHASVFNLFLILSGEKKNKNPIVRTPGSWLWRHRLREIFFVPLIKTGMYVCSSFVLCESLEELDKNEETHSRGVSLSQCTDAILPTSLFSLTSALDQSGFLLGTNSKTC